MDTDQAAARCNRMWRKLGGLYERAAYAAIEAHSFSVAIECARKADACFWQATGECDTIALKEVTSNG